MPAYSKSAKSAAAARAQFDRENALRAQAAVEEMAERRRHSAERHARERKKNIVRAVVSGGLIGLLLALGIYLDVVPWVGRSGVFAPREAGNRFSETRTGQILFTPIEGNSCRQVTFNNETGKFREVGQVACNAAQGTDGTGPTRGTGDRLESIRDAFVNR